MWIVASVFLGLVFLNVLAYSHARSMLKFTFTEERTDKPEELTFWQKVNILFTGICVPRSNRNQPPADLDADTQVITVHAPNDILHNGIILLGRSMGAAAILKAMHDHDIKPDGIIIEATFDKMLTTVRNRFHAMGVPSFPSAELLIFWGGFQWGFNGFRHNPVEYASSVQCPTIVMHGSNDPRATLAEGKSVFDAIATGQKGTI